MQSLSTAVLFMVYARPKTTRLVFEQIRKAKPSRLYLAADGPKLNNVSSIQKTVEVRQIIEQIDWDCQVERLFRNENLGCSKAVTEAIQWFFTMEDEGIILEDDCLPNESFFLFCQDLLGRYRNDPRVMHISGLNLQFGLKRSDASYYFSNIPSVWGWAGWKRSWYGYDIEMKLFPAFKKSNLIKHVLGDPKAARHALEILQLNFDHKIISWDHQYGFSIVINNGLCISPNVNLISNLGFSTEDNPTEESPYFLANLPTENVSFPLIHPGCFIPQKEADLFHVMWNIKDTKEHAHGRIKDMEWKGKHLLH